MAWHLVKQRDFTFTLLQCNYTLLKVSNINGVVADA
jgi:hypothetical protein